jgi:hypothetical protein
MANVYECANCGTVTTEKGHLCKPVAVEGDCSYCGKPAKDARHLCTSMREKLDYVCESCGRPAMKPELVCKPKKMST